MSTETRADLLAWLDARKGIPQPPPVRSHVCGEASGMAKLTEVEVIQIREAYAAGASLRQLATEYMVTTGTIGRIVRGRTWMHTSGPITYRSKEGERHATIKN